MPMPPTGLISERSSTSTSTVFGAGADGASPTRPPDSAGSRSRAPNAACGGVPAVAACWAVGACTDTTDARAALAPRATRARAGRGQVVAAGFVWVGSACCAGTTSPLRAGTSTVRSAGLAASTTAAKAGADMSPASSAPETDTTTPRLTDLALTDLATNPTLRQNDKAARNRARQAVLITTGAGSSHAEANALRADSNEFDQGSQRLQIPTCPDNTANRM